MRLSKSAVMLASGPVTSEIQRRFRNVMPSETFAAIGATASSFTGICPA